MTNDVLVVEWLAHMDAGDRRLWTADQDTRPLSELGWRQAERMCAELGSAPFDGLYSSAALRSRQTIEPLAKRFGLPILVLPGLHETDSWLPPMPWRHPDFRDYDPLGGSYAAGCAMAALQAMRAEHPVGRLAACCHGDVQPALVVYLIGAFGLDLPAPNRTRGGWYTLRFSGEDIEVEHHQVLPDFPL